MRWLVCVLVLAGMMAPASAQNNRAMVESSGDWVAFTEETARGPLCYAMSAAIRRGGSLEQGERVGEPHLTVSIWPAEDRYNEIALRVGHPLQPDLSVSVVIDGNQRFEMAPEGSSAWVMAPGASGSDTAHLAENNRLFDAMRAGLEMTTLAVSRKRNASLDAYSLRGFRQAVDAARLACEK